MTLSFMNIVGGFLITGKMLNLFRRKGGSRLFLRVLRRPGGCESAHVYRFWYFYFWSPPSSWCAALSGLCAPRALPLLLLPGGGAIVVDRNRDRDDRCDVGLYDRCAWAIGNLSGDSEGNRTALLSAHDDDDGDAGSSGILPRLAGCLSLGTSIL